jgi:hypothetical protein
MVLINCIQLKRGKRSEELELGGLRVGEVSIASLSLRKTRKGFRRSLHLSRSFQILPTGLDHFLNSPFGFIRAPSYRSNALSGKRGGRGKEIRFLRW